MSDGIKATWIICSSLLAALILLILMGLGLKAIQENSDLQTGYNKAVADCVASGRTPAECQSGLRNPQK